MERLPFKGDTMIGNDVWIGRESVIMPGVHIGDGAVAAARSVVAKDILAYSVAGGNPARLLKKRVDSELTELLLEWKWRDLPPEELAKTLRCCATRIWKRSRWSSRYGWRDHEIGSLPGMGRLPIFKILS